MKNLIKNIDPGKFFGIIILHKLFGYFGEILFFKMFWMEIYKCKMANNLKL